MKLKLLITVLLMATFNSSNGQVSNEEEKLLIAEISNAIAAKGESVWYGNVMTLKQLNKDTVILSNNININYQVKKCEFIALEFVENKTVYLSKFIMCQEPPARLARTKNLKYHYRFKRIDTKLYLITRKKLKRSFFQILSIEKSQLKSAAESITLVILKNSRT